MIQQNRYAEYGGQIVADTSATTFAKNVVAVKCLVETVVAAIACTSDRPVTGISWYVGKTLPAGHVIEANIASITLTSGAVQAIYMP